MAAPSGDSGRRRRPASSGGRRVRARGGGRGRELDRPAQRRGLVLGLLELALRDALGHDPRPGVDVRLAVLEHRAPDRDRGVEVAVVAEIAHGATIQAAPLALGGGDQLHRADLGGAGEGAGREHGAQRVEGVQLRAEPRLDVAHQVEDVAVALHLHVLAGAHRAGPGDPPEVVAAEVDEHHVLGALLGVAGGARRPGARRRRGWCRGAACRRSGGWTSGRPRPGRGAPGWRRRPRSHGVRVKNR